MSVRFETVFHSLSLSTCKEFIKVYFAAFYSCNMLNWGYKNVILCYFCKPHCILYTWVYQCTPVRWGQELPCVTGGRNMVSSFVGSNGDRHVRKTYNSQLTTSQNSELQVRTLNYFCNKFASRCNKRFFTDSLKNTAPQIIHTVRCSSRSRQQGLDPKLSNQLKACGASFQQVQRPLFTRVPNMAGLYTDT